eukprot:s3882_g11.t1
MCAADAMAQGCQVGIGGGSAPPPLSSGLPAPGTWTTSAVWPFLTKEPQKHIACFEVLAQLALLQCAWRRLRYKHQRFCMPAATDNSPRSRPQQAFQPIAHFLKLATQWAHARGIQLMLTHLPGEENAWADELSRDKLARFAHREHERMHVTTAAAQTDSQPAPFFAPTACQTSTARLHQLS